MVRYLRRLAMAALMASLAACGGGGGGGNSGQEATNSPPLALALASGDVRTEGAVLHATVGGTVQLDARGSTDPDGGTLKYRWTLSSKPQGSKLAATGETAVLSWQPDLLGSYAFELRVTDSVGAFGTRSVVVQADNRSPSATVVVSAAFTAVPFAAVPQSVTVGADVVVDATRTTDPDGQPVNVTFEWADKPAASQAALAVAGRSARFKPDVLGTYRLRVKGMDPHAAGFESLYTFMADNRGPSPVLLATVTEVVGTSRAATVEASVGYDVLLNGAGSTDPDGNALTRTWQLVSRPAGSSAALTADAGAATVLSPDVLGNYVVRLTATDTRGAKGTVETTVQVNNRRPVAQVGTNASPQSIPSAPDVQVPLGTQVTLRGDASADADGDTLRYLWTLDTRPTGSTASLSSTSTSKPLFTPDREGVYVFRLRVTDTEGAFSERTLTLRVGTHAPVAVVENEQVTVLPGDTVRPSAAPSFDEDGDSLTYAWSVDAKPVGSTATIGAATAETPSFVPDIAGIYVLAVRVSDGQSASIGYVTVRALPRFRSSVALGFTPGIARYSHGLDKLVIASTAPHALHPVDPFTGSVGAIGLPAAVKRLALSPDGKLAVALHQGTFSLVDLETSTLLRSTATGGNHTDAFVTNTGMVYLIGSSGGQWVLPYVQIYDGRTGIRNLSVREGSGSFYGTQTGVLAGRLNKVFVMSQGLSPADIAFFSIDPATSAVTGSGESPYHGDHSMWAPLYLSSDESLLFTSAGTVFNTADLTYAGSLSGVNAIASFSHSATRQEALVLEGGLTLPSVYRRFSGRRLVPEAALALPVVAGQQTYGAKVFHSSSGSHVMLVQAGNAQPNALGATHLVIVR